MKGRCFVLALWFLTGCLQPDPDQPQKIKIGFSQCTTGDDWRKTMIEEMRREIGFHPEYDIELIITDAKDDNDTQIQDIKELLGAGIDLLIVSPNEADPLTPVLEEVYDQGMPVIVIDRRINSEKFTSFIGGDNFVIGKEAALLAFQLLHGKGKVLEITGLVGSTPAVERSQGFFDGLREFPEIEVVTSFEGAWLKERAQDLTDTLFNSRKDFDLIFAHNDQMAYGAFLSANKYNLKPFILGVDGLYVPGAGIDMILNGQLDGTFLYPTGGNQALDLALKVLEGKPFAKLNHLTTITIDYHNARTFKMQANQLIEQQNRIDYQREQIGEMTFLLRKQETFILLSIVITGLLLVIALGSAFFLFQKHKANQTLDLQNKTIQAQNRRIAEKRDKLQRGLRVAEEATETKFRFFTDVSHEIRTVLNLISLPVDQLSKSNGEMDLDKDKMQSVKKSVDRLLSLSNEILDFRKTDYSLKSQTSDLGSFLGGIVEAFRDKANDKGVTLRAEIPSPIDANFDPGAIEKVMFNLVSNGLKFTPKGGKVAVRAFLDNGNVVVSVEDTGIAIPEQELLFVFERFYRAGPTKHRKEEPGTGIGLSLTKQLIQLHGGQIHVESIEGKGSTFTFTIPRYGVVSAKPDKELSQDSNAIEAEKRVGELVELEEYLGKPEEKPKVLLVEDNEELRAIVGEVLGSYFSVIYARNGQQGLDLAKEHQPDIVVSDILMPIMDGIEMCAKLKDDPVTFHIPLVLLTAIESEEYTIKGFETGADAYITKPFSEKVLVTRIRNLLHSYKRLKKEVDEWLFPLGKLRTKEKGDQEFMHKCVEIIYQNAANPAFNLSYLANSLNLSRSTLFRKIKHISGLKAVDFMKKAKLRYAAKLLLGHNLTVSEVAWQSGFADAKYFSRVFALEFGDLPSKFKAVGPKV